MKETNAKWMNDATRLDNSCVQCLLFRLLFRKRTLTFCGLNNNKNTTFPSVICSGADAEKTWQNRNNPHLWWKINFLKNPLVHEEPPSTKTARGGKQKLKPIIVGYPYTSCERIQITQTSARSTSRPNEVVHDIIEARITISDV